MPFLYYTHSISFFAANLFSIKHFSIAWYLNTSTVFEQANIHKTNEWGKKNEYSILFIHAICRFRFAFYLSLIRSVFLFFSFHSAEISNEMNLVPSSFLSLSLSLHFDRAHMSIFSGSRIQISAKRIIICFSHCLLFWKWCTIIINVPVRAEKKTVHKEKEIELRTVHLIYTWVDHRYVNCDNYETVQRFYWICLILRGSKVMDAAEN